jgi:hypothetical protein
MPIAEDPLNSLTTIATYTQPALTSEAYSPNGLNIELCAKTLDPTGGPGGIRATIDLEKAAQWLEAIAKLWNQIPAEDQLKYSADFPVFEPNPFAVGQEIQFVADSLRAYQQRDAFLIATLQGAMSFTK